MSVLIVLVIRLKLCKKRTKAQSGTKMSRKISMYLTMRPREAQIFCMKSLKSLNPQGYCLPLTKNAENLGKDNYFSTLLDHSVWFQSNTVSTLVSLCDNNFV